MSVGMDEVHRLVARAASTGAAVVIIILGPGQAADPPSDGPVVTATVAPVPTPPAPSTPLSSTRATTPPTTDHTPTTTARRTDRTPHTDPTHATGSANAKATAAPGSDGTATEATTAAATQGWGTPVRADDFDAGTDGWQVYDGVGNDGKGRRSPAAVAVRDGVLSITGDAAGTAGGVCRDTGRRYGRWEARVRAPASDPSYHAVLLLWPGDGRWPAGGEIDFMELVDPARRTAAGFVHHGADNRQDRGTVTTDATRWHDWAVEWTPSAITMFLDGRRWYRTTDHAAQPPGPMHVCVQLDWFRAGDGPVQPSTVQVDRVREYALDETAAPGGKPGGATGTGGTRTGD